MLLDYEDYFPDESQNEQNHVPSVKEDSESDESMLLDCDGYLADDSQNTASSAKESDSNDDSDESMLLDEHDLTDSSDSDIEIIQHGETRNNISFSEFLERLMLTVQMSVADNNAHPREE